METGPKNGNRTKEWKQNQRMETGSRMETGPMNRNRTNGMKAGPISTKKWPVERKSTHWLPNSLKEREKTEFLVSTSSL